MRSFVVFVLGTLALSGVAAAQAPPPPPFVSTVATAGKGYVEGVAQSAFGNVTSQSYGVELGVTVFTNVQVFLEGGMVRSVATSDVQTSAQQIAAYLTRTQPATVGYSVKEPATFGVAGLKYLVPIQGKVQPYVMAGGGIAKVKPQAAFTIGGTNVTGNLPQLGVQVGSALSSDFTKPIVVGGGGVMVPVWQHLVVDLQYRYGRILAQGGSITVSRAGIGIGVRF